MFYHAKLWGRKRKFLRKELSVDYGKKKKKTEGVRYLGSHTLELCENLRFVNLSFFRCNIGTIYLFPGS